jgi:hypothetical protein
LGHSKSATDRHGQRVDCGYIEQHSTVVLTADGSGEPAGDAGQGDGAAADAVGTGRSGGGGDYLAAPAAARSRRRRADVSPAGGGGQERGRHLGVGGDGGQRQGRGTGLGSSLLVAAAAAAMLSDACGGQRPWWAGTRLHESHSCDSCPGGDILCQDGGPRAALESPTWARCCH